MLFSVRSSVQEIQNFLSAFFFTILFPTGFTQFLAKDILDTFPQLLDNGLRMLFQLLTSWKNTISPNSKTVKDEHNRTIARKTERAQQVRLLSEKRC